MSDNDALHALLRLQKKLIGRGSGASCCTDVKIVKIREDFQKIKDTLAKLVAERDEARRYSCDLEARIIMLEEDRRDTSNNFGTNPCSEIILPDYPLAKDPKEIAKRKGWDCYKEDGKPCQ